MIVPMKKITVLVSIRYVEDALKKLRTLGTIHINCAGETVSRELSQFQEKAKELKTALSNIKDIRSKEESVCDYRAIPIFITEINSLHKERSNLLHRIEEIKSDLSWYEEWGDVSLSSLRDLQNAGLYLRLYLAGRKVLKNLIKEENLFVIKQIKNKVYIARIFSSPEDKLDFAERVIPPHKEQEVLREEWAEINKEIKRIDILFGMLAGCRDFYEKYRIDLDKEIKFHEVKSSMTSEVEFKYLSGFCPRENLPDIEKTAHKEGWGMSIEEPEDFKEVPTFIRYPRWAKIIEPVFKFIDTIPGYKEYDISFWFLLFFSVFFAMIISDGGYGLVLLLITFFVRKKLPALPRTPFLLMYVLAGTTLLWGAITGTWFGVEKIAQMPFFSSLVIPQLNSFVEANQAFLMYFCFLIGAVQLTIAHGIVAFRYLNSLFSLAQIGWISIIWGIFFLAGKLVLGNPFPDFAGYLLAIGGGLVILFSNPQKNIFKGIIISLANLPLKLISCFGDTLSYIRLFAVGYASVMIAVSFNKIALGIGFNNVISGLCTVLILVAAHAFNIILGLMAVLVHGIRLNMLEFSGHLNMEWSGKKYTPFKE